MFTTRCNNKIAKGFGKASLKLMHSYWTGKHERLKINNSYSLWSLIKNRVPQGSILGLVLFVIFLCVMFFLVDTIDTATYGDDNINRKKLI